MKRVSGIGWLVAVLVLASTAAWADRGHIHFGINVGPYWGPWYPPPVYYYPPPVVIERAPPPVYVEQAAPAPAAPAPGYWYYCRSANGYYPYVKECPGGWERVSPKPPGQP